MKFIYIVPIEQPHQTIHFVLMSLSYAQEALCRAHRPRPVYRPPDYNRPTCVYWNVLMETMKNAENPWQELEFLFKQFHHPYSVFFK